MGCLKKLLRYKSVLYVIPLYLWPLVVCEWRQVCTQNWAESYVVVFVVAGKAQGETEIRKQYI